MANTPPVVVSAKKIYIEEIPTSTAEVVLTATSTSEDLLISTSTSDAISISSSTSDVAPTATSTSGIVLTSASTSGVVLTSIKPPEEISTDLKLSFIFPKKSNDLYIGCTYQISWQASSTISSLGTVLVDSGSRDAVDPIKSGLARENKIGSSSSLEWKIGEVWPGDYFIRVSNIFGFEVKSDIFTIRKMSKSIRADEKEKICIETGGSF